METVRARTNLSSLTAGRGVAALLVAVHHATNVWGGSFTALGNVGWLGVTYFYVLSGFVLTWAFRSDRTNTEFFLHRFARIYPLHIATLGASLAAFCLIGSPLAGYVGTRVGTLASVLLVHGWIPGHPRIRQAWNGVSWSLSVEAFFYLLAPWLIRRLSRLSTRRLIDLCLLLYMVSVVAGAFAFQGQIGWLLDFLEYNPVARLPEFIYGIVAGIVFIRGVRFEMSLWSKYLLLMPIAVYYAGTHGAFNPTLMVALTVPACVVFILAGATRDIERTASHVLDRGLRAVGEASYSLYMTHALLLGLMAGALTRLHVDGSPTLKVLLFLALSLLLSLAVYRWFELPARHWVLRSAQPPKRLA